MLRRRTAGRRSRISCSGSLPSLSPSNTGSIRLLAFGCGSVVFWASPALATASVAYFQRARKYLILAGLVTYLVILNSDVYRDRFESMDVYYPKDDRSGPSQLVPLRQKIASLYYAAKRDGSGPDKDKAGSPEGLLENQKTLDAWREAATKAWAEDRRGDCKRPKLVVVSVSGGAARSAY